MRIPSSTVGRVAIVALAVVALLPLARLLAGGLWEPWELHRAEAARAVAEGQVPVWEVPEIEGEGSRPPLATWVTAVGFWWAGFDVTNGKLVVGIFLLLSILGALLTLLPLLGSTRALGAFAVFFALPVVFFQGSSAGGDGVAFGAYALAFAGLVRLLEASPESPERCRRDLLVGAAVTLVGFVLAYFALGTVLGIALPLAASALTSMVGGGLRRPQAPLGLDPPWVRFAVRLAAVVGAVGLVIWFVFAGVLHTPVEGTERFTLALGGTKTVLPLDTFSVLLTRLAYVLFPWCAFVPFALAWAMLPRGSEEGEETAAEAAPPDAALARHAAAHLLLGYGLVAYWHWRFHPPPLVFAFPLAVLIAEYLAHVRHQTRWLRFAGVIAAVLVLLVLRDSFLFPKDFLQIVGFPKPDAEVAETPVFPVVMTVGTVVFLFVLVLTHMAPLSSPRTNPLAWFSRQYDALREALRHLRHGSTDVRLAAAARLAPWVLGAIVWLCLVGGTLVVRYAEVSRWTVTHLGFQLLLAIGALPFAIALAVLCWCLAGRFVAGIDVAMRGWATLAAGVLVSLTIGLGVAPALDAKFSLEPAARAASLEGNLGGRLRLLQVPVAAARYYPSLAGGEPATDIAEAATWLGQALPGEPRYLIFRSDKRVLNEVNQKFREVRGGELLPVISDPAGRYLLATSELVEGEANRNPLARVVVRERPTPRYAILQSNFDNKVRYLGYDLTTRPDGTVSAMQNVTITHYWECIGKIPNDYRVFVHIDGMGDRINGDHDVAEGLYPTQYWRPGDFVIDRHQVRIPFFARPSREPTSYEMYVGFFRGETRLRLTEGEGADNRLRGGVLRVR